MLFVHLSESFVEFSQATYLYLYLEGAINIVMTPAPEWPHAPSQRMIRVVSLVNGEGVVGPV